MPAKTNGSIYNKRNKNQQLSYISLIIIRIYNMKYPIHNRDKKHKLLAIRQIANTHELHPYILQEATNEKNVRTEVNHVPGWKTQYCKPINSPKINLQIQCRLQQNPQLIFFMKCVQLTLKFIWKSKCAKAKIILKKETKRDLIYQIIKYIINFQYLKKMWYQNWNKQEDKWKQKINNSQTT